MFYLKQPVLRIALPISVKYNPVDGVQPIHAESGSPACETRTGDNQADMVIITSRILHADAST
jgi:hypothetical protein